MNKKQTLVFYKPSIDTVTLIPYYESGVQAGFPSPAQDYAESSIDLNKVLIKHPASTFFARVNGDSMSGEDILDGDMVIVDKSIDVIDGDLAVCYIDGDFTLKRVEFDNDVIWLVPSNPAYQRIKVTADNEFIIWGVVTYTVKNNRKKR